MALNPHAEKLSNGKIRMTWTPDLSAATQGYRFFKDGIAVSRTFDKSVDHIDFSDPGDDLVHDYGIKIMAETGTMESAKYPKSTPEPTPDPGDLPFPEATLSNPVSVTIPQDSANFNLPASTVGKDVLLLGERLPRDGVLIMDNSGGPPRNMQVNDFHFHCDKPVSQDSSGYRRGGLRFQTKAKWVSIRDMFCEGFSGSTATDTIGVASTTSTKFTVQRCLLEAPSDSNNGDGAHIDVIQCQGPIGALEIGLCSFDIAGVRPPNHAGKGLQMAYSNLPWPAGVIGDGFPITMKHVDFLARGNVGTGARYGTSILQEHADITISMEDVWFSVPTELYPLGDNFSVQVYTYQRPGDYGVVSGSKPNRKLSWATKPNAGVTGEFKERPTGTRFVTRAMLGY